MQKQFISERYVISKEILMEKYNRYFRKQFLSFAKLKYRPYV